MRYFILAIFCILLLSSCSDSDTPAPEKLTFRLPYADGTVVFVSRDHLTHTPAGRLDLRGFAHSFDSVRIVAAQKGVVRYVEDESTVVCCNGSCPNNYVWIEHENGYWTKYSHLLTGSATEADIYPGKEVEMGTYLGLESDIGRACGQHLHFEVAIPDHESRPLKYGNGGFIDGKNVIPVFCNDDVLEAGSSYVAGNCN